MSGMSRNFCKQLVDAKPILPSISSPSFSKKIFALSLNTVMAILFSTTTSSQDTHPGQAVYQQRCAVCHASPGDTRAPSFASLQQMSAQTIRFALTEGVMQAQASNIPTQQLNQVVDFLAAKSSDESDWVADMMCAPNKREIDLSQTASFTMFGVDHNSSRFLNAERAGLNSDELENLELAWAIGIPNASTLRGTPIIIGSTLFYSTHQASKVLALDTNSACVKWAYDAGAPISNSIAYGTLGENGMPALIFATRGDVHTLDPNTGELIWKANAQHSRRAGITGSPVLFKDKIIVPLSASGVGSGARDTVECCSEHGAVVALAAASGEKLWTFHTMKDAEYTGKVNSKGVKLKGPSGAPIWSTPSVDAKRGVVYATTGQATSLPATTTSDAILAIDIETGELKWHFQALANDVWHLGCRVPWENSGANCPSPEDSVLKDFDFGGAPIIATNINGKDLILAGQKSGDVWAIDPDNQGKLVWHNRFGQGTALGGVHWGMAANKEILFAPISDPHINSTDDGWQPEPGMNAIDISSGEVLWRMPVSADCDSGRKQRYPLCEGRYGLSATPLAIDSSVISGSIDGKIYIHDATTGKVIWQYDTLKDFTTMNGVEAKGGSIDSHSISAGDGMVFITSGYGRFSQPAGNVLLAFKPKAKAK